VILSELDLPLRAATGCFGTQTGRLWPRRRRAARAEDDTCPFKRNAATGSSGNRQRGRRWTRNAGERGRRLTRSRKIRMTNWHPAYGAKDFCVDCANFRNNERVLSARFSYSRTPIIKASRPDRTRCPLAADVGGKIETARTTAGRRWYLVIRLQPLYRTAWSASIFVCSVLRVRRTGGSRAFSSITT